MKLAQLALIKNSVSAGPDGIGKRFIIYEDSTHIILVTAFERVFIKAMQIDLDKTGRNIKYSLIDIV